MDRKGTRTGDVPPAPVKELGLTKKAKSGPRALKVGSKRTMITKSVLEPQGGAIGSKAARVADKAVGTPMATLNARPTGIMAFNVPECSSTSLQARESHDLQTWASICSTIGLDIPNATRMNRLAGKPTASSPRPLRIEMPTPECAQAVLLSASSLKGTQLEHIALRPDLPKNARKIFRSKGNRESRQVVIRGVPESLDEASRHKHDCSQWQYSASKLQIPDIVAWDLSRLPRPSHLVSLQQPRLLRVTLASPDMVDKVLDGWRDTKSRLPSGLVIHSCQDRGSRSAARSARGTKALSPRLEVVPIDPSGTSEPSKNGEMPTH